VWWFLRRRKAAALCSGVLVFSSVVTAVDAIPPTDDLELGVTYSPRYAAGLGLDPRATYVRMMDELGVRRVRLPLYWEEIEPVRGTYDFSDLDFYLLESEARGVTIILSVGYKQPRWPECYPPRWAADLSTDALRPLILGLVGAEVRYARRWSHVRMWQVENEPFVHFGDCGDATVLTPEFVNEEIALIHQLDERHVLLTDSGEWSTLLPAMSTPNVDIGVSVYRDVPLSGFGLSRYPLPAWSYTAKDWVARSITGVHNATIISELQCEPWFVNGNLKEVPYEVQRSQFPPEQIVLANLEYAQRTHFRSAYMWGAEWWYWMASHGHAEYLEAARYAFARYAAR